jgi:hypothetical protein
MYKNCQKVVKYLSKSCHKAVKKLLKRCPKVSTNSETGRRRRRRRRRRFVAPKTGTTLSHLAKRTETFSDIRTYGQFFTGKKIINQVFLPLN